MKKIGALSIAAFYLLLTTGMYVCILHCAGDYFLKSHEKEEHSYAAESDNHKSESNDHEEKSCGDNENCVCCNTHGQFAIKENTPPATNIHFTAIALLVNTSEFTDLFISSREITSITWPKGNAPPIGLKEPLYISYRSLLI
ncbi:MAG TPA: hypothetical protein DIT07_16055 [Sphingobacteriaceae bacterium]|nr:hypothetical protein [Sphingobacteriaceae bacterium]